MTKPYDFLKQKFKDIWAINDALAILNRDMITVMPEGAGESRTNQMVTLSALVNEKLADPVIQELIVKARASGDITDPADKINLDLMERAHKHIAAVPDQLSRDLTALSSQGYQNHDAWRENKDERRALEHLEEVFAVNKQIAEIKQKALETKTPYDALIDLYDPYSDAEKIKALFAPVKDFLVETIPDAVAKSENMPDLADTHKPQKFPQEKQAILFRVIADKMGFDFKRGRMEMIPAHPSCYGALDDMRFTTRIDENEFIEPMRALIHEVGHGLYEQNLPRQWRYTPVGSSQGMTIHESQSLFWERQISLHPAFQKWLAPVLHDIGLMPDRSLEEISLYLAHQKTSVTPSLIRIEADEMTYPLHIFIRFEIEQALMAGEMEVQDLPEVWNDKMHSYLGITPQDATKGWMQDIHWFCGDVGYFPSYTLGAMCASQLYAAMMKDIPDLEQKTEKGNFGEVLLWLNKYVHSYGSSLKPMELVKEATGEALNPIYFINHLKARYLKP